MKEYTTTWSIKDNGKTHVEEADLLDIEHILVYGYGRMFTSQEREALVAMKAGQSITINLSDSLDSLVVTAKHDIVPCPF